MNLGIWLHSHMTCQSHIDELCSKVRCRTALLWSLRNVISQSLVYDLLKSLIDPLFIYGDTIYDGCSKTLKSKLQVHQNFSLTAVLNINRYYPSRALHDELDCEWLDMSRRKHCCAMIYKGLNNLSPATINSMFLIQSETV